ncbi:sulfotransferase family protein [Formosa sp. 3Alg 14/1]|uniref:sulfotransferase family protein n=1 Tax=Formosa sp. 3Alg 14/1 TaxID=3382190 RepID=UPI0039BEA77E
MREPNFIIIGGMNTGTTSLHKYLSYHDDIFMSNPKELDFFNQSKNYNKGVDFYKSYFNTTRKVAGECSPNYTKGNSDEVAERIFRTLPNVKLIYIVRNPVDRFLSQCRFHNLDPDYLCNDYFGDKEFPFDVMISGMYGLHYERFIKYFNKEQILVINHNSLLNERIDTMNLVFNFLKVEKKNYDFSKINFKEHNLKTKELPSKFVVYLNKLTVYNFLKKHLNNDNFLKSAYHALMYSKPQKKQFDEKLKPKVYNHFKNDIEKFELLTNMNFKDWKI